MSIQVIAKVLPKRWGSPTRKIVAIKLADVAREDGSRIYPSIATVASEAELSERQVQRVMREFVDERLLIVVRKGGGRHRTTEYRLDLEAIDRLPDAKAVTDEGEQADNRNGDRLSPFKTETVTMTTRKGDTVSPDPSLPFNTPYGETSSAPNGAGAEAPSVNAEIWKEGLILLKTSLSDQQSRKLLGRWCKRAPSEESKIKLLAIVRAARRAGTGDPVAYVTKAVNEAFPPPPDPRQFTDNEWKIKIQAAIKFGEWPPEWGPAPSNRRCLVPSYLILPELIASISKKEGRAHACSPLPNHPCVMPLDITSATRVKEVTTPSENCEQHSECVKLETRNRVVMAPRPQDRCLEGKPVFR